MLKELFADLMGKDATDWNLYEKYTIQLKVIYEP